MRMVIIVKMCLCCVYLAALRFLFGFLACFLLGGGLGKVVVLFVFEGF